MGDFISNCLLVGRLIWTNLLITALYIQLKDHDSQEYIKFK